MALYTVLKVSSSLSEMGLSEQRSDKSDLHCNTVPFTAV